MIQFKNSYTNLPERFFERVQAASFSNPELILFNETLATELNIDFNGVNTHELAKIFTGQKLLPGSDPIAQAYAGFQFGQPVPQLGDGRALLLGEAQGQDIQLKGSGRTKFSRGGDGRSALGPVLREYLVSEAMHALGIPTTRALAAVRTGEQVVRQDGPEPGGVFTRVASSHLRVGTFQYFAFQNDLEGLEVLLKYAINRHYPELLKLDNLADQVIAFLKALTLRQADLIAQWNSVGFIHGVMNTDNFSIAGITIDYGPCAFMDEFKFNKVFSSIDRKGRYSYINQIPIAQWNILRLADCLLPFIHEDTETAIARVEEELGEVFPEFELRFQQRMGHKLGISDFENNDSDLILSFLKYLEAEELDFTLSFRNLPELYHGTSNFLPKTKALNTFLDKWKSRGVNIDNIDQLNPLIIPRNHQIERAIQSSYSGNDDVFLNMVEAIKNPFNSDNNSPFILPPKTNERINKTFCGT